MKYARLFDQVQQELARMKRVVAKNQAYLRILDTDQDDPTAFELDIAGIAMNLQGFYTGAERIFLGIAREIDDYVPRGDVVYENAERLARCYANLQNQCIVFQHRMVESS